ncbi:transglycosylase domain-containing protein [Kitasatospora sp. NPDC057015]|uniref:transglycosylase domain-containing protein n=1 Tax=Kitasatospora sp. NPDC057015 TaxID=3346001 RepID=UPI0036449D11
MSERRRRSDHPGGGDQRPGGGRPNAHGSPPAGAPAGGAVPGGDELRSDGLGRRRPGGARDTAQQPRMTRAELRKAGQKGGKRGAAEPPAGRGGAQGPGKPGKKRFIDYPRFGKTGVRRWVPSWRLWLSGFLLFFGGGVAAVGVAYANTTVPDIHDLVKEQNNIYYWADGSEMTRKGETNRQIVELSDISVNVQNAVIAAENETFRTDPGIDPKGILRALYNMAKGGQTQGASTITQQYVKNAYLSQEQTLDRKVKEFFITLKINQQMEKNDILKGYLNTSWFGRSSTGIQAAAQSYYGVNAKDVDICQSAMLANLLKGAAVQDPSLSPANHARAESRWKAILDLMVKTKAITAEDRAKCTVFPDPIPRKPAANMNGEVSYLVDTANKFIMAKDKTITQQQIDKGGFKVYTTFEKDKVDALKKAVDDVQAETLNVTKRPELDKFVQVGAASVRPGDGAIVAIYGGPGVENNHYDNNADAKGIPVGSTFKPFVLATAMQNGVLTETDKQGKPARINADSRYLSDDMSEIRKPDGSLVIGDDGKPYRQKNEDSAKRGYISLRQAMQWSYNVPFVQLNQDVGGQNVADMAEKLGLKKETFTDPKTPTFALGTSTPSSIRMASAYATFAASGKEADPYSVTKVEYSGKEKPGFAKPELKQVLDAAVADNITDVLVNVAKNGTGSKSNALGRPVAGKTGTTDQNKSAWWVGYTPQLSTAVSMWREDPSNPGLKTLNGTGGKDSNHGGDTPTDIFTRYMKAALANEKKVNFPTPEPVGSQIDSSGAPSTASPTASPTATETAPPATEAPVVPAPQPTAVVPTCVPGVDCPDSSPSPTATRTRPTPGQSCIPLLTCTSPSPSASTADPTKPGKPTASGAPVP